MKKIFALLLTAALIFALTACGSSNTAGSSESTGTSQSTSTPESTDVSDDVPETTPSESPEISLPSESEVTQSAAGESDGTDILIA